MTSLLFNLAFETKGGGVPIPPVTPEQQAMMDEIRGDQDNNLRILHSDEKGPGKEGFLDVMDKSASQSGEGGEVAPPAPSGPTTTGPGK